jgi:hypothetical protein
MRVLRVPHTRTRMVGRIHAVFFRAALSPAADKRTDTAANATPQPPGHAGERTLLVFTFALRVPS